MIFIETMSHIIICKIKMHSLFDYPSWQLFWLLLNHSHNPSKKKRKTEINQKKIKLKNLALYFLLFSLHRMFCDVTVL